MFHTKALQDLDEIHGKITNNSAIEANVDEMNLPIVLMQDVRTIPLSFPHTPRLLHYDSHCVLWIFSH